MASIGKLNLMLSVGTSAFVTGLNTARGALGSFSAFAAKTSNGLSTFGVSANGAMGLVLGLAHATKSLAESAIEAAAGEERQLVSLELLTGSVEEGKRAMEQMENLGLSTPFATDDLVNARRQLLSVGFSLNESMDLIERLGPLAASNVGGMKEGLDTIIGSLSKMRAEMRVTQRELKSLGAAGIPIGEALAKSMGVSISEVRRMMADETISVNQVLQALDTLAQDPRFAAAMERQAGTVLGMWTRFKNLVSETMEDLGAGLIKALDIRGGIGQLEGVFTRMRESIGAWEPQLRIVGAAFVAMKDMVVASMEILIDKFNQLAPGGAEAEDRIVSMKLAFIDFTEAAAIGLVKVLGVLTQIVIKAGELTGAIEKKSEPGWWTKASTRGLAWILRKTDWMFSDRGRLANLDVEPELAAHAGAGSPAAIADGILKNMEQGIREAAAALRNRESTADLRNGLFAGLAGPGAAAGLGIVANFKEHGQKAGELGGQAAGGAFVAAFGKQLDRQRDLKTRVEDQIPKELAAKLETPLSKAQDQLKQMNNLQQQGILNWDQYLQLVDQLGTELEKTLATPVDFKTGASLFGTKEAEQALLAYQKAGTKQSDPVKRLEDLLKLALKEQKDARKALQDLASPEKKLVVAVRDE